MPQNQVTLIYYYIPEDLDDLSQLNAFVIKKNIQDIKLPDIVRDFPLMGSYHFRFRYAVKKNLVVWLDLMNSTCRLPAHQQKIIMKVTRISWDEDKKREFLSSQSFAPMQRISSSSSVAPTTASKSQSPIKQQQKSPVPAQSNSIYSFEFTYSFLDLLNDEVFSQELKDNNNSNGFSNNNNSTFNNNFDNNAPKLQQQSKPLRAPPPHPMMNGNNLMFGATNQDVSAGCTQAQSSQLLKLESTSPQIQEEKSNKQFSILTPLQGLSFN